MSFKLTPVGSPPDAPVYFKVRFAEIPYGSRRRFQLLRRYQPGLNSGRVHTCERSSAVIFLPPRYAFRYMELTVIDTSAKYKVILSDVSCKSVSSTDMSIVPALKIDDPDLVQMDKVSLKTMQNCTQLVYEDGPKRDRRLWIGDLRLQALTNYETFKNNDLVKRCLYLFAGLAQNKSRAGACRFLELKLHFR